MRQELGAGPRTLTLQCHPGQQPLQPVTGFRIFLDSTHGQLLTLDTVYQSLQATLAPLAPKCLPALGIQWEDHQGYLVSLGLLTTQREEGERKTPSGNSQS